MSQSHPTPDRPAGPPDWDVIARHAAGESTADESAAVGAWLSAHPEDARILQLLAEASSRLPHAAAAGVDVEAALARVHERMRTPSAPVIPLRPATRSRRTVLPWAAAAAAVLVVAAGLLRSGREPGASAPRVIATAVGQLDSVRLADGSRVVLGPSSEFTIAAGYARGRREVQLRGTAYFEVRHDASHPFTVRGGDAVITDIGTAFTVRADDADGVDVSVHEGSVRVRGAAGGDAVLAAGDAATLQQSGTLAVTRAGASDDDLAWTRGRLVFRETSLARVRADLRRWFGVVLVVSDSALANRHLTASFQKETRRQVLDVIALALGATYEMRADTVTLRPAPSTIRAQK